MKNNISNIKEIKKITLIGLFFNLLLASIKFALGVIGNSKAVIADGIHSLSDMATDFAVIVGVKYWEPPADETHPYGHKKIETAITLMIGLILFLVAFRIVYNSIETIPQPHQKKSLWYAAIGPFISITIKEILYHWTIQIGKKTRSSAVIANAWHHRSDALSSIPAFITVVIASIFPALSFIDHIGAIVVAIFIFKVSWDIIKPSFMELTDCGANKKVIDEIIKISLNVKGVKNVHKIRTRISGGAYFIDLHVLVNGLISVNKGHEISEEVKKVLIQKCPEVIDVVVHLEPFL